MPAPEGNQYAAGNPGGGRNSDYRPEYVRVAFQMALLGATDEELGAAFGVSETTVNNWKKAHDEFSCALTRGKIHADAGMAERLYMRGMGYSHDAVKIFMPAGASEPVYAPYTEHYPPDTQAASLWLRNRQPAKWRDKQEHEHAGPGGKDLIPPEVEPSKVCLAILNLLHAAKLKTEDGKEES